MISRRERVANYVIAGIFVLIVGLPLIGMLLAALQPPSRTVTGLGVPQSLEFGNFITAWETGGFGRALLNSVIVAVSVILLSGVLSVLAGFALGIMRFRGSQAIFYLFIAGLVLPIEAFIIPLYFDLRTIGLTNTYLAIILPEAALFLSFGVFWMRAFFRAVPKELIEAAQVDGATSAQLLWRILVPVGKPAIVTMVLLMGMWSWNEFLIPLIMIRDLHLRTAPLGLSYFEGQWVTDVSGVAAGALIVAAPMILLYMFVHRQLIRGVLAGAIDG